MRTGIVSIVLAWSFVAAISAARGDEPIKNPPATGAVSHAPLAEGRDGMVVGLTGRRAVHAGLEILKQGGGAADAAMASAMVQIVEAAGSSISFAGILSMVYYDAVSHSYHYLNAGYNTPVNETDPASIPGMDPIAGTGTPSGRTALVPGFMAGAQAARDRFGKLSMTQIVAPAIALAEDGFEADPELAWSIEYRRGVLGRLPETKRVFTRVDGKFYGRGDRFRQPELAATLRQVAEQGAAFMYTGDWARRFVDAVRREGGKLTPRDLETYRAVWEAPIEATLRGARIIAPGFSSRGGVDAVEAINLLELADLRPHGPPSRSPESLCWLMQITRNQLLFDTPDEAARQFPGRDLSPRMRTTAEHARWLWERIKQGEPPFTTSPAGPRPGHSSGVVVVDRWGNAAAVTHSINTVLWGNTGIFVGGVSIPDSAAFQQDAIKRAGPGHRLPDPMSPLIVAKGGRPVLVSSAIGGGLHQRNIQVLAGVLEFGLDAQTAVDSPAFLSPDWSGSTALAQVKAGAFDAGVLEGVRALGQKVKELKPAEAAMFVGHWAGIVIDVKAGRLKGAGTSELPSYAEGY
jgi:gamma-glutamyltranspeptidase / glutathione hydrolase